MGRPFGPVPAPLTLVAVVGTTVVSSTGVVVAVVTAVVTAVVALVVGAAVVSATELEVVESVGQSAGVAAPATAGIDRMAMSSAPATATRLRAPRVTSTRLPVGRDDAMERA
jgi:hypothetical protein